MPRTTPEYDAARRRQILEAAHRCFSEGGLRGTTMQAVAHEAGLSAGALYRYFDGKEDLFVALASRAAEGRRRIFEPPPDGEEPGGLAARVARMMEALQGPGAERSVRLDVRLWAEALDDPEVARAVRSALASIREPVARHFMEPEPGEGERPGAGTAARAEAAGRIVVSLLVGLELQRAHDEALDVAAYRDLAHELLSHLERSRG